MKKRMLSIVLALVLLLTLLPASVLAAEPVTVTIGGITLADNAIPDVKTDDAHGDEIYCFYRAGILTGSDAAGSFFPGSTIRRCEAAAILIRMYDTNARQAITLN